LLDDFWQDLRYASRLLRSTPMFTAVVVLTLALGIGANTAIFGVMNVVVLRLLPVPEAGRLVYVRTTGFPNGTNNTGAGDASFPVHVFERLRLERDVFQDLTAFVPMGLDKVAVRYGSEPEEANANMVSGNFFSGLGVRPLCGRMLAPDDETSHTQVAVLSYDFWRRRFGENCAVVGQALQVRGVSFTIVGVAASSFIGVDRAKATDLWVPLQDRRDLNAWGMQRETFYRSPNWWCLMMIGRLAPGVSEKAAQSKLNPVFQQAAYAHLGKPAEGERPPTLSFRRARGISDLRQAYEEPLRWLLAMVGLVLVIACGNVAMLLVARNDARQREFSVRMALGGGRARLFRQLLTESLLLVSAGAALGWFFGVAATAALSEWSELNLSLAPDRTVLLFTLALSAAVTLVFGLAPVRGAARVPLGLTLKTASATAYSGRERLLGRRIVVALQVALCLTLLVGAGLLVRTMSNLQQINLGLRTPGLFVFGISPQQQVRSDAGSIRFFEALLERLRSVPRVESVTLMQNRIGSGWSNNTTAHVDGKDPLSDKPSMMRWNAVGPDYFRTLGTPLRFGRDFTEADSASAPKVAIINETFAQRFLPSQSPLGHQVSLSRRKDAPQYTIVGVAADSKYTGVRERPVPMAYFPYKQMSGVATMHVEVRTAGNPVDLVPAIRQAVREIAPEVPMLRPVTQQQQFESSFSQERLIGRLSMFFGLLAALLVATGVYGTLAYTVSRRTSEVGIRMALGAQRAEVVWMVLRESMGVCAVGIAFGLPLAFACSRLLRSMLYGVLPADPLTFAAAVASIPIVALVAGLVPAVRAASISPMAALRSE